MLVFASHSDEFLARAVRDGDLDGAWPDAETGGIEEVVDRLQGARGGCDVAQIRRSLAAEALASGEGDR